MAKSKKDDILSAIEEMSVTDLVELISAIEEKFGVTAAAAVAATPVAAGSGEDATEAAEEKDNFDVVYTYYNKKKYGFFKNIGSKFNDIVANFLLTKPKHLYLSSFKFINRFLITEIIKHQSPFTYIDGLILGTTNKIGKIEVEHGERTYGKSGYTLMKMLQLWSNMSTSFSIFPLRLSLLICLLYTSPSPRDLSTSRMPSSA